MSMRSASIPVALPSTDSKSLPAYIPLGDLGDVQLEPRCGLHLSREQPALHSAEIQRARARPRLDRCRGAGAHRQERERAAGLPAGMVRRVRRTAGGEAAARR